MRVIVDPNVPPGQFFMLAKEADLSSYSALDDISDILEKPATIGADMDPLDRKLGDIQRDIEALTKRVNQMQRRQVLYDADVAKGRRLIGSLLVLIGRRLRSEDA